MTEKIDLLNLNALAEDHTQEFQLNHRDAFAVKKDGQVYAYENVCPHLQISLNFMPNDFLDSEKRFITCTNHGALFEIETGLCVAGPCMGEYLTKIQIDS